MDGTQDGRTGGKLINAGRAGPPRPGYKSQQRSQDRKLKDSSRRSPPAAVRPYSTESIRFCRSLARRSAARSSAGDVAQCNGRRRPNDRTQFRCRRRQSTSHVDSPKHVMSVVVLGPPSACPPAVYLTYIHKYTPPHNGEAAGGVAPHRTGWDDTSTTTSLQS